MKIISIVSQYFLALIFTVFGLNGFLHFIPMQSMPGLAGQFGAVMAASHYFVAVFAIQLVCGLLFLVNRFIPLALTLIAPVIVNILLFHILMAPQGLMPGAIAALCWILVYIRFHNAFAGILKDSHP